MGLCDVTSEGVPGGAVPKIDAPPHPRDLEDEAQRRKTLLVSAPRTDAAYLGEVDDDRRRRAHRLVRGAKDFPF